MENKLVSFRPEVSISPIQESNVNSVFTPNTYILETNAGAKQFVDFLKVLEESDQYASLKENLIYRELHNELQGLIDNQEITEKDLEDVRTYNDEIIGLLLEEIITFHYGWDEVLENAGTNIVFNEKGEIVIQFDPTLFYNVKAGKIYGQGTCATEAHFKQFFINDLTIHKGELAKSKSYENGKETHVRVAIADERIASPIDTELSDSSNTFRAFDIVNAKAEDNPPTYSGIEMKNDNAEVTFAKGDLELHNDSIEEMKIAGNVIAESKYGSVVLATKEDTNYYYIGLRSPAGAACIIIDKKNQEFPYRDIIETGEDEMPFHLAQLISTKLVLKLLK
ncbi:MAG TPA: hypothetical protein VLG12_05135 [Candidatus Saccharimonadales bacterium]|nr:hypothetical protein [Candidatus Saccharimonadales bacterium]